MLCHSSKAYWWLWEHCIYGLATHCLWWLTQLCMCMLVVFPRPGCVFACCNLLRLAFMLFLNMIVKSLLGGHCWWCRSVVGAASQNLIWAWGNDFRSLRFVKYIRYRQIQRGINLHGEDVVVLLCSLPTAKPWSSSSFSSRYVFVSMLNMTRCTARVSTMGTKTIQLHT